MKRRDPQRRDARRQRLVASLQRAGITDRRVLDAIGRIPRELFVPEALRARAYEQNRLPIGFGQTISQPWTVARQCELATLPQNAARARVLEIGAGSGYQTAVLAQIGARVFAVERHAELARQAARRLRDLDFFNATVKQFDGTYGWGAEAPFDRIIVAAGGPEIPTALVDQLNVDGRLVIPLARQGQQRLTVVVRTAAGLREEDHGPATFVPLIGRFGYRPDRPIG